MNKKINSFIDSVIKQKKLIFSSNEIKFDDSLFKKDILKIKSEKVSVNNFVIIAAHYLNRFKIENSVVLEKKFDNNVKLA